ncbi:MAG: hypothetical protein K2K38_05790 [Clostridia bacterium]|nr:hypothetical protein [Clostridia bacterium]
MSKVILKTALKTLLIVAVVVLVAFGIASLGFPSEMAGLCEKSGNYSMATGYANLSYTYSKNVNDLNRCFADSIYAKNDNDIVKFGDKLIADEKFSEVCENAEKVVELQVNYKQYVCGHVSAAKYRRGNKDDAFNTATAAMEGVEGFPKNNALAMLSLQVIESRDKDTAAKLLNEITTNHQEAGNDYYNAFIKELNNVGGQD